MFPKGQFLLLKIKLCLVFGICGLVSSLVHGAPVVSRLAGNELFPIGVWLQKPEHAGRYRNIGINLYVGLWKGPTADQLDKLKSFEMPVICEQNEIALKPVYRDTVVGWQQMDEPDNAQPLVGNFGLRRLGWGDPISPSEMHLRYQTIQKIDPSRPVFMNLGKGVAWDRWKGRGSRTGRLEDYPFYMQASDIVSFDIYPAAETDASVTGRLELVALGVERMVRWGGPNKTVWSFIGASKVSNPNAEVNAAQIRSQVWMSIIGGAKGLIYFVHQFKPSFKEAPILDDVKLMLALSEINSEVQGLASVILRPEANLAAESNSGAIGIASRQSGCSDYLFVVSLSPRAQNLRIQLSDADSNKVVEVIGEGRKLKVSSGELEDSFDPYAVHMYKMLSSRSCR